MAHEPEDKAVGYSNIGIQGGVTQGRRDYKGTFADLIAAIKGKYCIHLGCESSAIVPTWAHLLCDLK